jgi:putative FmdB family regulatory protein
MPTYDYVCRACGHRVEVHHGLNVDGPTQCPNCHSHAFRKAIAAPAIVFKGSGWAKKDRSRSTTRTAAARDTAGGDTAGGDAGPSGGEDGPSGGEDVSTTKGGTSTTSADASPGGRPKTGGTGAADAAGSASAGRSNPGLGVD